jgi:5-methylcytosine-specific restriction endonuclease McrA
MAKDLNIIFSLSKLKPVKYRVNDVAKLRDNPIVSSDDWTSSEFNSIKRFLRHLHYKSQNRRCSYCRRLLNPLGVNEHIDHIIARSIKSGWMFKPRNLVLACYQCNTQKSAVSAIPVGQIFKRLPQKPHNYILFNPYVHKWSEHFEIEDNLFLKAISIVGQNTITELNLFDYKYSIKYADEANVFGETAIKRATKRMAKFNKNSIEFKSALKLIKEIERHI